MDLNYCASSANASPRPSSCSPPAPARAIAPAASTPAPTIICPNPSAPKNSSPASAPYCAAPATPRPLRRRSSKPATSASTQPRARSGARTSSSRSPPSNSTSWRSWPAPPAAPSPATSSPPCFTSAAPRPTNARSTCTSATCARSSNARIAPSSAPSAAWDTSSPHEGLHQNSPVEFRHAGLIVNTLQTSIGREHVHPVGIQHVDLASVRAERRETGRIPGHVEGGANSFALIQLDLRRGQLRLAVRAGGHFLLPVARLFLFTFLQRLEGALLWREKEFRQRLISQCRVDEENDQRGDDYGRDIDQAPQAFPQGALRIIEDGLRHG